MISAEKHGTIGRTYEEDDEDIVNDLDFGANTKVLQVNYNENYKNKRLLVQTQFISVDSISSVLISSIVDNLDLENIGTISVNDTVYSTLYYGEQNKIGLVTVEKDVPPQLLTQWLKLVFSNAPSFTLSFGSMNISTFFGDINSNSEGTLRKLESCKSSSEWNRVGHTADSVRQLEIGNIVTGTAAAVLTYCEARSMASLLLISVTSASRSVAESRIFEQAWTLYERLLSSALPRPSQKEYLKAVKNDAFLQVTENLYC
jgi:hypothetical protein